MRNKILCYPSKVSFPSISITGEDCNFSCIHCNRKYLKFMMHVPQENLYEKAIELENRGTKGILVSGGLDKSGRVPIDYSILRKIKIDTKLMINLHSGLLRREDAKEIKNSKIDVVSVDFVGSNDTIKNILKVPFKVSDYEDTVRFLIEEEVNVVPHICVGLDKGKVIGEYNAVEILKRYPIKSLTLLVLIKNELEKTGSIIYDIQSIKDFFTYTRNSFPGAKISLGCMRPRIKELDEIALIFDNIVNPTKNMIKLIRNEGNVTVKEICCSLC
ncbi:MAG: Radical SAM superfamily protein [Candidatus Methanofastidiosum methylothiophilum]|uniref:Radical SAM superfamily protein n=1 Tax=Candidatus Methanofastidiosum methylothiophilum TaxID=1705564 RepID=A0A150IPV1_9EURY|nr:MAG: Radical SAM superfamily protein [Candidatus Methanofastidiosum methylthiophilus]KYC46882.1 MAG: Radical SAM superfamily protein [Candidatus Methanofastidiosum methylthiophilus]KYC49311.1 MAG: Radical SAM superfamily protein [Candidatus Methanofastidiosum methylthiophilus]